MISLGIDPGTRRVGYGIVRKEMNEVVFVAAGLVDIKSADDVGALRETKDGVDRLIKKYKPDIMGIERLFFAKNQKTAIAVAQARGVILLSACEKDLFIKEYTPNEVKTSITGYGFSDKKAVLKMVKLILKKSDLKVIDDASDALAIAIIAAGERLL